MSKHTIGKAVAVAMAACIGLSAQAAVSQRAVRLNDEGVAFVQKGEVKKAIESFKAAIDDDEHCVDAVHNLGKLLISAKNYALAEKLLGYASSKNPGDSGILVQLAQATALQGRKAECEAALKRLAEVDKAQLPSLALLLSGQLSHECAERAAEIAVEANPQDAEAWYDKGIVAQRAKKTAAAAAAYAKAAELKPGYVDALVNLGNMKYELDKVDDALAAYEKAFAAAPKSSLALYNLGRTLLLKGRDPSRGLDLLQEATKHGEEPGAVAARKLLLDLVAKTEAGMKAADKKKGGAK